MLAPPIFTGENYQIWAVKMESYLQASDLWDAIVEDKVPLGEDPTMAQIRNHREERRRRYKAKTCIHSAVLDEVFIRIMACETTKQA